MHTRTCHLQPPLYDEMDCKFEATMPKPGGHKKAQAFLCLFVAKRSV